MHRLAPIALAALAFPIAQAAPRAALVETQLRIDVDAQGRVVAAEPTAALPTPVADALRRHAASWTFEAPTRGGVALPGTTYARLSVCAAPDAGGQGLVFALGPARNGPGVDERMLRPSFFPPVSDTMLALGRLEMDVVYEVGADGRASVVSLATRPDTPRARREIEVAFRRWIAPMRFQPERIDGVAVATRMHLPVTFTWERARPGARRDDLERRRVEASPTCQALLGAPAGGARPQVAVDSPFRLQPSG